MYATSDAHARARITARNTSDEASRYPRGVDENYRTIEVDHKTQDNSAILRRSKAMFSNHVFLLNFTHVTLWPLLVEKKTFE